MVITVNGRTNRRKTWDEHAAGPGTFSVINASSGVPMGNFSTETLELLREYGIEAELNKPGAPRFYGVEVAAVEVRERLEAWPCGRLSTVNAPVPGEQVRAARSAPFQIGLYREACTGQTGGSPSRQRRAAAVGSAAIRRPTSAVI